MKAEDQTWGERASKLSTEELVQIAASEEDTYRADYLDAVKNELSRRGFSFSSAGEESRVISPEGIRIKVKKPTDETAELLRYRGVGGWLALFIFILFVRGVLSLGESLRSFISATDELQVFAAMIDVIFGIFAVLVCFSLLRERTERPVRLTKIFLITNMTLILLWLILLSLLARLADPVMIVAKVISTILGSILWLSYFSQSRRVKATYLMNKNSLRDSDVVTLGLGK